MRFNGDGGRGIYCLRGVSSDECPSTTQEAAADCRDVVSETGGELPRSQLDEIRLFSSLAVTEATRSEPAENMRWGATAFGEDGCDRDEGRRAVLERM